MKSIFIVTNPVNEFIDLFHEKYIYINNFFMNYLYKNEISRNISISVFKYFNYLT